MNRSIFRGRSPRATVKEETEGTFKVEGMSATMQDAFEFAVIDAIQNGMDRAKPLPELECAGNAVHMISIKSTFTFHGVLYYVVQRRSGSTQHRPVARRYSDFLKLDKLLASSRGLTRTKLPPREKVGLRRMLNSSAFLRKRQEGLQQYLDHLAEQAGGMDDTYVVEFLQRS